MAHVILVFLLLAFPALCAAERDLQISTAAAPSVPINEPRPPAPSAAGQVTAPTGRYRIHRVWLWQETRDCLWNLARQYYGDPWLWKKIYLANRHQIADPRVIYPKQELIIPEPDEKEK